MTLNACSLLAVATAYRYAPMLQPGGAASSPQALVMSLLLSCALAKRGFTQSLLLSLSYAYAVAGRGFVI